MHAIILCGMQYSAANYCGTVEHQNIFFKKEGNLPNTITTPIQLLLYKTNRKHKQEKKTEGIGTTITDIAIGCHLFVSLCVHVYVFMCCVYSFLKEQ
jgi:hypothetical protein